MKHSCSTVRAITISFFVVVCLCSQGFCIGLETYSLVHPFGLSSATTSRVFGMGGEVSCVWDQGFGNPAFAATQSVPNASLRVSTTSFDRGPRLTSEHAHFVTPLRENISGLQVSLFSLHSTTGTTMMPGPTGALTAVNIKMSEEDISIHYGRKVSKKLAAGVGVSPYSQIKLKLSLPGGPALMDVKAEPDFGLRGGLAYEWGAPGAHDYIGAVYDYYQETAKATGIAAAPRGVYHTDLLAVGASRHVRPDVLVAAEYQRGSSHSGQVEGSISGWHVGAEYLPVAKLSLRAGLNDCHPTYGIGYSDDRWQVNYAYASRWNDDIAGDLLGASSTHQLQAIYQW